MGCGPLGRAVKRDPPKDRRLTCLICCLLAVMNGYKLQKVLHHCSDRGHHILAAPL
jgi:hypothetical protein